MVKNIYVNRYGDLCERNSFYSNVYLHYEQAFQVGIEEVNERIKKLQDKDIDYQNDEMATFIRKQIYYHFVIHELIIMEAIDQFERKIVQQCYKTKVMVSEETDLYQLCRDHSLSIDYIFDDQGNLIERHEMRLEGLQYLRMPNDYQENARRLFSVGDVVRVKEKQRYGFATDNHYVVASVPGLLRDAENIFSWENIYALDFVYIEDGKLWNEYDTFHESQIEKVEDDLICQQVRRLMAMAEYKS
ncbi:hypothetical protein GH808_14995 [Acetobacterium fimetarium]|uniref:Uncharacterized protein n=1 Tax=Acetobacterium fimetarium TaxID=52691 RepID=A0ABR6WYS4_9FIRM|nr:hypothetical protein [Acetobacterium fimetarium]MBC3805710.1 hypothetical protein [Acetobacterium fimetarium]